MFMIQFIAIMQFNQKSTQDQIGYGEIPNDTTVNEEDDLEEDWKEEDEKKYGQEKHEKIKTLRDNKKHIYVSVELPHRRSERPELFRINDYGDLVIIIDDRNMEHVFGSSIKKLMENLREKSNKNQDLFRKRRKRKQEDLMDQTE
ncbi:hypothetical protein RclHR1_04880005 [Rhizophagus clarus]|uniref:Uncharacterized protein n=1 Tax=Rhizophagus clarus TaxID=94130 RepID=A0A2Z6S186_9GLOM|nr:hypothetical protein RclHR1_04880005 [Rhizophagus clarus]